MLRRPVPLGLMAWVVIGLIVAAQKNFLDNLDSLTRLLSAVLAVICWPLVLLKIHMGI